MTRAAAPRLRGTVSSSRPQWMRAAVPHLQVYVFLWAWAWAVILVGIAVAILVYGSVGTVTVSVAQFVRNGPLVWFLFAVAIIIATSYLAPHVANGMTRRSFYRGALMAGGVNGLLHGGTAAVVVLIEGAVYERMGWQHAMPGDPPTSGIWEQGAGLLLLDYTLAALAGTVSGLLVGITYYRLGGWWGTLALPLTVLPILYTMFSTSWSEAPFVPWDLPPISVHGAGAVLVAGAAGAFGLLTRTVSVKRSES